MTIETRMQIGIASYFLFGFVSSLVSLRFGFCMPTCRGSNIPSPGKTVFMFTVMWPMFYFFGLLLLSIKFFGWIGSLAFGEDCVRHKKNPKDCFVCRNIKDAPEILEQIAAIELGLA